MAFAFVVLAESAQASDAKSRIEARAGVSAPQGMIYSSSSSTVTLSRALRLGLAVRTRPRGPLRLGLVAETGSRASLRVHHRPTGATSAAPGYRYFGLGLQGSIDRNDRWGFVRLEAGPMVGGYSGQKGFACQTDVSSFSDMCGAAGAASTRLGRAGLMVGVARGGLPGLRRVGVGFDDRITWWEGRPRHDLSLGLVVQLRHP